MPSETPADRAIVRLLEEMRRKHLSQRDLAGILDWSQSRVSKNLNGRIELGVNDLAALCFAVGIPLTEAVRDHGLEFCAEMTPMELRLLERFRQLSPQDRDHLIGILDIKQATRREPRAALAPHKKRSG
jgi:transcriptional regulator with XRE-family HTH domain